MTEPGKTHDKTFLGEEVIFTGLVTGLLMKRSVSGVKGESEALKSVNGEGEGTVDGGEGSRSNVGQRQWPAASPPVSWHLREPMPLVTLNQRTVVRMRGPVKRSGTRYPPKHAGDGIQRGAIIRCNKMPGE